MKRLKSSKMRKESQEPGASEEPQTGANASKICISQGWKIEQGRLAELKALLCTLWATDDSVSFLTSNTECRDPHKEMQEVSLSLDTKLPSNEKFWRLWAGSGEQGMRRGSLCRQMEGQASRSFHPLRKSLRSGPPHQDPYMSSKN